MIDMADLQAFLLKIEGGTVPVDLFKIGQANASQLNNASSSKKQTLQRKLRLAIDMEDCLDRFYGGYYSDWACGGQWNRAYEFVQLLANAFSVAHVELIAFFDGTLKENKKMEFQYNDFRQKTISVLKHIRMIATPPPKIWWLPPSGIRTCLRNALRIINIQVVQTVNDHTMEVLEYFHEFKLDGILGQHPDYIVANTSRYFSSHDLRLSYKGALETKEYMVSKLLSSLSLTADHLPYVAVLLGGYILIDDAKLKAIYKKINVDYTSSFDVRIRRLAEVIRNSPTNEVEAFIKHFELADYADDIKLSIDYYQRKGKQLANKKFSNNKKKTIDNKPISEPVPQLASEVKGDNDEYSEKMLKDVNTLVDDGDYEKFGERKVDQQITVTSVAGPSVGKATNGKMVQFVYTLPGEVIKTSLNRHQCGIMDPRIYQLLTKKEIFLPQILEDEQSRKQCPSVHLFYRPARQMIYAILFNLYHQKYLCSNKNKDKQSNNVGHVPQVSVSEWIWTLQNEYKKAEVVFATQLPWAVPTIQRLWFGTAFEDKQRRIRAFLTIMRSDTPSMLNRNYVPQHMLVMACVLRYMVTGLNVLTRPELDAFLATAFSLQLTNVEYTQELVLPAVQLRGVYLATMFMQGVETASMANDACGVPLPWMMTNPWLFFDGKLFHLKLKMSTCVQSIRDLCDDHIDIVLKIERFRKAILQDIEHYLPPGPMDPLYHGISNFVHGSNLTHPAYGKTTQYQQIANLQTLTNGSHAYFNAQPAPIFYRANTSAVSRATNNRNQRYNNQQFQINAGRHTFIDRQGGYQLKVGGVVVGSWAGGVPNRPLGVQSRFNRSAIMRYGGKSRLGATSTRRNQGNIGVSTRMSRTAYGIKSNRSRNRRNRNGKDKKNKLSTKKVDDPDKKVTNEATTSINIEVVPIILAKNDDKNAIDSKINQPNNGSTNIENNQQNGPIVLTSDLVKSICHDILKEEENVQDTNEAEKQTADDTTDIKSLTAAVNQLEIVENSTNDIDNLNLNSINIDKSVSPVNSGAVKVVNGNDKSQKKKNNKKPVKSVNVLTECEALEDRG